MEDGASAQITNIPKLKDKFNRTMNRLQDFTEPFMLIRSKWYEQNERLFTNTSGPEPYEDFKSPKIKDRKQVELGHAYPILVYTGKMSESLLTSGAEGNVEVIEKQEMTLGTEIEYAIYHQLGTENMVARSPVINRYAQGNMSQDWQIREIEYVGILKDFTKRAINEEFAH